MRSVAKKLKTIPFSAPGVFYFGAHYSKSLIWAFFNTFFLFFAIYGLGLSPLLAGVISFAFAATDAIFDLPGSFLIHRFASYGNGIANVVALATPICCLFLCLAFLNLSALGPALSIASCVTAGIAFRLAFTFIDIPLNASIGRTNYNSKIRNGVAGWRSVGSALAVISLAVLLALVAEQDGKVIAYKLWQIALIVSIIACIILIPSFSAVDEAARRVEKPSANIEISEIVRLMRKNITQNFAILFAINFVSLLLVSQFFRAVIFIVEREIAGTPSFSEALILITIVSGITVAPWMALASRLEKNHAAIVANIGLLFAVLSFGFLNSTAGGVLLFFVLFGSFHHWNTFIWSILPDTTDEISKNAGTALYAPVIGFFAAFGKMTIGLGGLLGGWLLHISGFPENPNFETYTYYISGSTALGCILSILLYSRYKLTHEKYSKIPTALLKDQSHDASVIASPRSDK